MPNYQSKQVVYGEAFLDLVIGALKVDPGAALVVAPKVRLSTSPAFNPTPESTIVNFTPNEAAFSGYTAGGYALTLGGILNIALNVRGILGTVFPTATAVDPFVDATVYGYWVDDGANVILAEKFAGGASFTFAEAGDFLALEVIVALGNYQLLG